jgi:hypothetical protein
MGKFLQDSNCILFVAFRWLYDISSLTCDFSFIFSVYLVAFVLIDVLYAL